MKAASAAPDGPKKGAKAASESPGRGKKAEDIVKADVDTTALALDAAREAEEQTAGKRAGKQTRSVSQRSHPS